MLKKKSLKWQKKKKGYMEYGWSKIKNSSLK